MNPEPEPLLEHFFASRDQKAFSRLVTLHSPLVLAAALRITRNRQLAEEISQTVFSRLAWLPARKLPAGVPLAAWLHRETRSLSIDALRSEKRRKAREHATAASHATEADFPWDQISPAVDEVIDHLPVLERQLILTRYLAGASNEEIARSWGVSEESIRRRLSRALEKVRACSGSGASPPLPRRSPRRCRSMGLCPCLPD